MSGCLCLFVLLTHLAEIAEMARGLMEVFAEYGEPHIPKHHRHRPCPHQQQAAQRWWKGQRTSVCALCFQAEKKSFIFSLSFRLCKQFQRLFMHNLFCPVGCLWVTCSVCLFSLVLSTSPLIAVSLANSFSFAFWIPYWVDSPNTSLNASRGSEMPPRPDPNLKVKTRLKSAASGLLSTQQHAGSPRACASLLTPNYIQPTMTCSWQLHLLSSSGRQSRTTSAHCPRYTAGPVALGSSLQQPYCGSYDGPN